MERVRCFIAIEMPAAARDAIDRASAWLRSRLGSDVIRWVPTPNVHLTLKFLGESTPSGVHIIRQAMEAEASRSEPFELTLSGLGMFPSQREPRVLWLGLSSPANLISLQQRLETAGMHLGYDSDHRGFSPHLTLGRVRHGMQAGTAQRIRNELENAPLPEPVSFEVREICLFRSDLLPSGARYTKLAGAALAGARADT